MNKIYPHSQLLKLDECLWQVTGSLPRGSLPRNMILYRFDDNSLLLHSVVALDEKTMQKIEILGQPKVMIVPNRMHKLDAIWYKKRYPKIKVICPEFSKRSIKKTVPIDNICESLLPTMNIKYHSPEGTFGFEYVYELNLLSGKALIMTDILFNLPHLPGFDGLIMRIIGSTGFFGMTRIGKLFVLKKKKLFKEWLIKQSKREDIKLISVAHGNPITSDCSKALIAAANRL